MYISHMDKKSARRPSGALAKPPPLLTIVLHEGGMITLDKRKIEDCLMRALEYQSLAEITTWIYSVLGELIELSHKVRLADVVANPVMDQPQRPQ